MDAVEVLSQNDLNNSESRDRLDDKEKLESDVKVEYPTFSMAINNLGWCFEKNYKQMDWALDCYRLSHKKGYKIGTYNYGTFLSCEVRKELVRTMRFVKYDLDDKVFLRDHVGFTAPGTGFDSDIEELEKQLEDVKSQINALDKKVLKLFLKYTQLDPDDASGWFELGVTYFNLFEMDPNNVEYQQRRIDAYTKAFDLGKYRVAPVLLEYYGLDRHAELGAKKCTEISNSVMDKIYTVLKENHDQKKPQPLLASTISKISLAYGTNSEIYSVTTNEERSFELSLMAANMGDMNAKFNVGMSYYNGQGVPLDTKKAYEFFLETAEWGDRDGQREIGLFNEYGFGDIKRNLQEAKKWYKKAADNYDPDSCFKLIKWGSEYCSSTHNYEEVAEEFKDPEVRSELLLKAVRTLKYRQHWKSLKKQKTLNIPIDVLFIWFDKITEDIPKLRSKIIELECRPPPENGGSVFQSAIQDYYCANQDTN